MSKIYCFKNASLGLNNNTCDIRFNIDNRTENKKKLTEILLPHKSAELMTKPTVKLSHLFA